MKKKSGRCGEGMLAIIMPDISIGRFDNVLYVVI